MSGQNNYGSNVRRRRGFFSPFLNVGSRFADNLVSITTNSIMQSGDIYNSVLTTFSDPGYTQLREQYVKKASTLWLISVILAGIYLASFIVFVSFAAGTNPINQIKPSVLKHVTVYDSGSGQFVESDVFISPLEGYLLYPVVLAFVGLAALAALIPLSFGARMAWRRYFPVRVVATKVTRVTVIEGEEDEDGCWGCSGCCEYDEEIEETVVVDQVMGPSMGFGNDGIDMVQENSNVDVPLLNEISEFGGAYYVEVLMFGMNRVHWIEVAMSSALIGWICGQLAGINDIFQLVGIMMLSITGILVSGLLQECANTGISMYSRKMIWDAATSTAPGEGNKWWMKFSVSWWSYVLGTIPYLTVWAFLFAYLAIEAASVPRASLLPWYVWTIVIGMGILGLSYWGIILVRFVKLQWALNHEMKTAEVIASKRDDAFVLRSMKAVLENNYSYELWKQGVKAIVVLVGTWVMFAAMFY